MDILKGYPTDVVFPVPSDLTTAQFQVFVNGSQVGATGNATVSNGLATVAPPYSVTLTEQELEFRLLFTYQAESITLTKKVNVVTPILEKYEILEIHPNATDPEVLKIEAAVRYIIQAHCGQTFGHYVGKKTVYGRGSKQLQLPARLISLTSVNDVIDEQRLIRHDEGWQLHYYPWGLPYGYASGVYMTGGVMHDPTNWSEGWWENGIAYVIEGDWGYINVPEQVREAAKLLVNDYACGDNQYRDRFLTSMTAADWRIQFHAGAFANTGNVRANQLLEDYVVKNTPWVAI